MPLAPALAQPAFAQPAFAQPALAQPALAQPAFAQPAFEGPTETGVIASPEITEASGLVASRRNPGVLWITNDSGDEARVFAVMPDGRALATYRLRGANAVDYEDLAVGPGPVDGVSYLYVGDIGDNLARRRSIAVYRLPEPDTTGASGEIDVDDVVRIELRYPDQAHDAESLLCDPRNGDLYVVTKDWQGNNLVFRGAAPRDGRATVELTKVGTIRFPGTEPSHLLATAGDIDATGGAILVRSYERALLWRRRDDQSIADALATDPVVVPVPDPTREAQGEAIAFRSDGKAYFTVGEGVAPPLLRFDAIENR